MPIVQTLSVVVWLAAALAGCTRWGFSDSSSDRRDRGTSDAPSSDRWNADRPFDFARPDERPGERVLADRPLADDSSIPGGWVTLAAGTFMMGSPTDEPCRYDDETLHQVTLTHAFEISITEVTQGQFQEIMGYNNSGFISCGVDCPVEMITWHEAAAYCNALSARSGLAACYRCTGSQAAVSCQEEPGLPGSIYSCPGYRLPTEAEWEYAYRAGTKTSYYNGDNDSSACSCTPVDGYANDIAWYCGNASETIHPVGQKEPNAWGLRDMAGNAFEWCNDWWTIDLGSIDVEDPIGAGSGTERVIKGGSWYMLAQWLRGAARVNSDPTNSDDTTSFRCVRTR